MTSPSTIFALNGGLTHGERYVLALPLDIAPSQWELNMIARLNKKANRHCEFVRKWFKIVGNGWVNPEKEQFHDLRDNIVENYRPRMEQVMCDIEDDLFPERVIQ